MVKREGLRLVWLAFLDIWHWSLVAWLRCSIDVLNGLDRWLGWVFDEFLSNFTGCWVDQSTFGHRRHRPVQTVADWIFRLWFCCFAHWPGGSCACGRFSRKVNAGSVSLMPDTCDFSGWISLHLWGVQWVGGAGLPLVRKLLLVRCHTPLSRLLLQSCYWPDNLLANWLLLKLLGHVFTPIQRELGHKTSVGHQFRALFRRRYFLLDLALHRPALRLKRLVQSRLIFWVRNFLARSGYPHLENVGRGIVNARAVFVSRPRAALLHLLLKRVECKPWTNSCLVTNWLLRRRGYFVPSTLLV